MFTVVAGVMVLKAPWVPHADFDVVGFLWVLQNLGPIVVRGLLIVFGVGALYAWYRAFREIE